MSRTSLQTKKYKRSPGLVLMAHALEPPEGPPEGPSEPDRLRLACIILFSNKTPTPRYPIYDYQAIDFSSHVIAKRHPTLLEAIFITCLPSQRLPPPFPLKYCKTLLAIQVPTAKLSN